MFFCAFTTAIQSLDAQGTPVYQLLEANKKKCHIKYRTIRRLRWFRCHLFNFITAIWQGNDIDCYCAWSTNSGLCGIECEKKHQIIVCCWSSDKIRFVVVVVAESSSGWSTFQLVFIDILHMSIVESETKRKYWRRKAIKPFGKSTGKPGCVKTSIKIK